MKIGPDPAADRGGCLLTQRGVRLVADHDRVRVGDASGVADEPLVGLDRDRAIGSVLAVEQGPVNPVAIAAVAELAMELVDEVAAVGEDQDAAGARSLDEAERGNGLAGAGRMLEPEALVGVGILRLLLGDVRIEVFLVLPVERLLVVLALAVLDVLVLFFARDRRRRELRRLRRLGRPGSRAVTAVALGLGDQRGQRARQRVDLVGGQHGAVGEVRLLLGQQALEPEQQRELPTPVDRRQRRAGVQLRQGSVERPAPCRPRGQGVLERLAFVNEALASEQFRTRNRGRTRKRGGVTHRRWFGNASRSGAAAEHRSG